MQLAIIKLATVSPRITSHKPAARTYKKHSWPLKAVAPAIYAAQAKTKEKQWAERQDIAGC